MQLDPLLIRDFSKGVYRKVAVNSFLTPENSVSHSLNFNYDEVIGSAQVRKGTTLVGSTVASNKTPLGLFEFTTSGNGTRYMIVGFSGGTTSSLYYSTGSSWSTSGLTTLSNSAKNRFAQLGGRVYRVNGVDAMNSSTDANSWGTTNCIITDSVIPSLIIRSKGRLLTAGYSGFRDRVYFSSVIDPNASPTLTWSTNASTGDWIDINPDDGSNITGFAETSTVVLVFKERGMYRLNVITRTVDTDNIFNIGAVSQEAITTCQGVVYFFSGKDIRRTNGGFPEQISRLGVQDFLDAIPQTSWANVAAGTDGLNVYFSIGNVTLFTNQDNQVTYTNVVLKFSPRDESWSVHSYAQQYRFFANYVTSAGITFIGADTSGSVQTLNSGTTDNTTPIYYTLETQELEFRNRAHIKKISDNIVIFGKNLIDTQVEYIPEDGNIVPIQMKVNERVNIGRALNIEARYLTLKISGQSSNSTPLFEGFYIENIQDTGIN